MIEKTSQAALQRVIDNTCILGSAVQLGVDVLRELHEGGALGCDNIRGEDITVAGVRNLLVATIGNELSKVKGGSK